MPLVKRSTEPLFVCRTQLPQGIKNELEAVVVTSLAGLIKQLSNLSKHAEGLFGELIDDASAIFQRTVAMDRRLGTLREKVKALDPAVSEQVKLEDIYHKNHFKADQNEQQQILDRHTLPTSLLEVYASCTKPPNLNGFTSYREDGKTGLQFYTDPDYFYALWVKEEQEKINERKKNRAERRRHNRRSRNHSQKNIEAAQKKSYSNLDREFADEKRGSKTTLERSYKAQNDSNSSNCPPLEQDPLKVPPSIPPPPLPSTSSTSQLRAPPPPPPPPPAFGDETVVKNTPTIHLPGDTLMGKTALPPPPPPPPPPNFIPSRKRPSSNDPVDQVVSGLSPYIAPPPPPPPPVYTSHFPPSTVIQPPVTIPFPPPPPGSNTIEVAMQPPVLGQHNTLLKAIEEGIKLRQVERIADEKKPPAPETGVASILRRRIAIELSDTESDSSGDSDSEDNSKWD